MTGLFGSQLQRTSISVSILFIFQMLKRSSDDVAHVVHRFCPVYSHFTLYSSTICQSFVVYGTNMLLYLALLNDLVSKLTSSLSAVTHDFFCVAARTVTTELPPREPYCSFEAATKLFVPRRKVYQLANKFQILNFWCCFT